MAIIDPGMSGFTAASDVARIQPDERRATGFFGWGGFVNFYTNGAAVNEVQNVTNVFAVRGLGSERTEYPTGAPGDDEESYELGRVMTSPVSLEAWLSSDDTGDTDESHNMLMNAFDSNTLLHLVIGLGDNRRLFAFSARVRRFLIDASIDSAVRLQVDFRPSGKMTRVARVP